MSEKNNVLLNELISIEELESKLAPSGAVPVGD